MQLEDHSTFKSSIMLILNVLIQYYSTILLVSFSFHSFEFVVEHRASANVLHRTRFGSISPSFPHVRPHRFSSQDLLHVFWGRPSRLLPWELYQCGVWCCSEVSLVFGRCISISSSNLLSDGVLGCSLLQVLVGDLFWTSYVEDIS